MSRRKKKYAGKTFSSIDHEIQDHPAFMGLSARGKALVWLVLRHFNGKNNGKIPVSADVIRAWLRCGWRAIAPTVAEVEASRIAVRTKLGIYRPGTALQATEWRLTFLPVGDQPATHDYRRPAAQAVETARKEPDRPRPAPKIKAGTHSGNRPVPTLGTEKPGFCTKPPAKEAIPVPTVGTDRAIFGTHSGNTCKVPLGTARSGTVVVGSNLVSDAAGGPPQADPAAATKNGRSAGPGEQRAKMRAWAVEGKSPPGLGERLKHWRVAGRGWSRRELAEASGLSEPTITNIENGRQNVRPETYRALVNALAIDPLTAKNMLAPLEEAALMAGLPKEARVPAGGARQKAAWLHDHIAAGAFTREGAAAAAGVLPEHIAEVVSGRERFGAGLWQKLAALASSKAH
jgi:transcriptional regulator with XRE-family HTH domain